MPIAPGRIWLTPNAHAPSPPNRGTRTSQPVRPRFAGGRARRPARSRSAAHGAAWSARHSRTPQQATLTAATAISASGCQALSQIMTELTIAVTARLSTSVRPAWTTPSPVSAQHITAAPAGTQASSSAPASAGACPGAARTSTAARTPATIPDQAVSTVRRCGAGGAAAAPLTLAAIWAPLTAAASR